MISFGKNIRDAGDALQKASVNSLYEAIQNPSQEVRSLLRQLRIIREMNAAQYAEIKKQLPYFVCAIFNPAHRKTENFAYTEYFIIDIDHIAQKGYVMQQLRSTICGDPRAAMCFLSPSGDGLKVMFRLKERCYDAMLHKIFYRLFAERFASQYNLQQVVDIRTCDVTRACFMSCDENVYFNAQSNPVDITDYINADADLLQAFDLKRKTEAAEKEESRTPNPNKPPIDPDRETMQTIRNTLNPNSRLSKQKADVFVPEALNEIISDLVAHIENMSVKVNEVRDINYGKKMRFSVGLKHAEINLFYGKRGFSVVQSPRTGTDSELNQLMAEVIEAFIYEKF